jgi:hypothetical protein
MQLTFSSRAPIQRSERSLVSSTSFLYILQEQNRGKEPAHAIGPPEICPCASCGLGRRLRLEHILWNDPHYSGLGRSRNLVLRAQTGNSRPAKVPGCHCTLGSTSLLAGRWPGAHRAFVYRHNASRCFRLHRRPNMAVGSSGHLASFSAHGLSGVCGRSERLFYPRSSRWKHFPQGHDPSHTSTCS